jgi:hypothetical protein
MNKEPYWVPEQTIQVVHKSRTSILYPDACRFQRPEGVESLGVRWVVSPENERTARPYCDPKGIFSRGLDMIPFSPASPVEMCI